MLVALTAPALVVGAAAPASAAEPAKAGPVLTSAVVDVRPDVERSSTSVREEVVLGKVAEGATVRNLLTRFDGVRVTDLEITVAGESVEPRSRRGERLTTLSFASPVSGELRYTVTYRVESADGVSKMPLLVPAYAGGETRAVTFTYRIPDGYHLQGSPFPVGIGSTGTQTRKLLGVPTFLDYRLGTARTGPLTSFNVVGAAVVALIIALTIVTFAREARAGRRGDSRV